MVISKLYHRNKCALVSTSFTSSKLSIHSTLSELVARTASIVKEILIISDMVEEKDCSIKPALLAFAQVGPPGIYKEDYVR